MNSILSLTITTIAATSLIASLVSAQPLPYSRGEVLFEDNFNSLSNWVVEQMPGGTVTIEDSKLVIDDPKGCTVWFRHKLDSPVIIEYEVTMIQAGGPNDDARDLNCFWMSIDPRYPNDIFRDTHRTGQFRTYDNLRHYYVGYGGHRNTQTRFRRYNGLGERPLLPQHDLSRAEYMITPNKKKQIQIVTIGNRTQYIRDGDVIFDFTDDEPYSDGWFAFRTVSNHMTVENFTVTRLIPGVGVDLNPPLMRLGAYDDGHVVRQISAGTAPSMHAYMDICPESPDATHVTYFEFENEVPGWGRVVVANRDGSDPRYVSGQVRGGDHDGTRQQWLDNDHLIFGIEDEAWSIIVNVNDNTSRKVEGSIGMVSETNGYGLTHNNYPASRYKGPDRKASEVMIMDLDAGTTRVLLNRDEMVPMHPRKDIIEDPQWKGLGVFKHPKWSPDGKQFFWVYMLEKKGTNTKLVKSALLADSDGGAIRYVTEIGQHAMWSGNDALLSYIRPEGFHITDNPSGQHVMIHPINGEPDYPLIPNALGIHGSLNPKGDLFVTDIFDWPEKGAHAVLMYDVASGNYRELVRMRAEPDDPKNSMHPHPVWSRDGNGIYFNGSDTGERRLYYIDLTNYSFRAVQKR